MPRNMQRPMVTMNTVIVAKRSMWLPCGIAIGLSVNRNSPARPIVIAVQITMVCPGVERSELKLNTMNIVQRNIPPTSGAT